MLTDCTASGLCGFVSRERNRSFYTLTFSAIFVVTGSGLLSSLSFNSKIPRLVYFYQVILGLGIGGTLVSTILTVKLNAGEEDAGKSMVAFLLPFALRQARSDIMT